MLRPLKKKKRDGTPYTRPPAVVRAVEFALQQDETTLSERALLGRKAPDYLPSECLLYLIRDAKRSGDRQRMNRFFGLLIARCVGNLRETVSDGLPAAEELREEIIGGLAELIAIDGTAHDQRHKLDYFEVRFDSAFRTLRINVLRAHEKHSDAADASEDVELIAGDDTPSADFAVRECLELVAQHLDLLTPKERTAVGLHYLEGVEIESEDTEKITVARLMAVSGRMVRKYLQKAREKLRTALERTP